MGSGHDRESIARRIEQHICRSPSQRCLDGIRRIRRLTPIAPLLGRIPKRVVIPSLTIGPLNSASQANAWARAVESHLHLGAMTVAFDGVIARHVARTGVKESADRALPHYRLSPQWWRRASATRAIPPGTVHLNESNFPLWGDPRSARFTDEIALLERRDVKSAVVFHGSDIRDPALSMELNRHSFFHSADEAWVRESTRRTLRNREAVLAAGLPLFVTTPDLLEHLPGAQLLPLAVKTEDWASPVPAFTRAVPRVLHRPSANGSTLRGTAHILPVLERLESSGRIEIIRSDVVPRRLMPQLVASADILVDQVQIGAYGVTAIEAMAAGRLVVGDVSAKARAAVGGAVPIVNASPDDLEDVLNRLLDDTDSARAAALQGPDFARRWHDGRAAALVLRRLLGLTTASRPTDKPSFNGEESDER